MDVVNFIEEYKRMCESFENCASCPLLTEDCDNFRNSEFVEKAVPAVEAWASAHPRKTRQSLFLEQHPEVLIGQNGVLRLCPVYLSASYRNEEGSCIDPDVQCTNCRRKFWLQEVE